MVTFWKLDETGKLLLDMVKFTAKLDNDTSGELWWRVLKLT